jgi:CDP-6-deoxy-D-xylo-4-hexulose-3-dehydrase
MRFKRQFGDLPFGYDHKYIYSHIGYNLKVTDMQAAIGVAQLDKLPYFIEKRKENFNKINEKIKKYEKYFIMPKATEKSDPSWFGYPLTVKDDAGFTRNELTQHLEDNNIMTRLLFAGNITKQPAYINENHRIIGDLKNTDNIMNNTFFIGVYPEIDDPQVDYIEKVFDEFFEKVKNGS